MPPSSQLDGFDVSDVQFTKPHSLPPNVKLHVANAHDDPDPSFCGVYDLVNVRLLQAAVADNDPSFIVKHVMKLLSR